MATAGGTLVLAVATFSAVQSSNRSARVAERALMAGLRPLLMPSRLDDPPQKVGFVDGRLLRVDGGRGAVLDGWRFSLQPEPGSGPPPPVEEFHRLIRDIYVPPGDMGFWQGVFRDPKTAEFRQAADAIAAGERLVVDILYGDHEGGQRAVSRLSMTTTSDGGWLVSAARHWNIDRDDPR
jgi:hypothetical protein